MTARPALLAALLLFACGQPSAEEPPPAPSREAPRFSGLDGFLDADDAEEVLAGVTDLPLEADTSGLGPGERVVLEELLAVGETFQRLYERQRHPEAAAVRAHLEAYAPADDAERAQLEALRGLLYVFRGPVADTRSRGRFAIAPIDADVPSGGLYPTGVDAEALRAYAEAHGPDEAGDLFGVRTVVRARTADALAADIDALDAHPALDVLHPTLRPMLERPADDDGFYAVPYALAYADEMHDAHARLRRAADAVRGEDEDLADYLEQRGRDLLTNDYEAGDAVWIRGRTTHVNAEIGAYETYDDHILGTKAFFAMSVLVRAGDGGAFDAAIASLPAFEAELPGGPYGTVESNIPLGVYGVVADFGQARGANTATILPNESHPVRRYGRTILLRGNVLTHPVVLRNNQRRFQAAVAEAHDGDLGRLGRFHRTVFHEVGHYLGPKRTADGRRLADALGTLTNTLEEMKADLVSLWLMPRLVGLGVLTPEEQRDAYAAGVLRALLSRAPRETEAYGRMQLMQQRFFFDRGVLAFDDGEEGALRIDYDAMPRAVEELLGRVLDLQAGGDRDRAEAFVREWAVWDEDAQGIIAARIAPVSPQRFRVTYAALGAD